ELTSHQKRIDETKGNIIEVLNKISDCRNHLTRYRTIESSLNERLDKISELSGDKLTEQNSLIELESSLQNKIIVTKKQIQENLNAKTTLEESIKAMKQTLFSQEEQIQKEKQQLVGKDSRLKLLVDMKKGYEGFNKSVKEVLLACQSNNEVAHKVCGVIASLITVPKDYELAIETVLGGSLQHIVTEHEEDAKYLIGFLRKHNYGRATFLPISSIRGRSLNHNEKEVLKMKGCCGIASDIVSCDPKYKDILENLLGRVVVAEDLDAAVDMARRFSYGFRIVTLLGDVVNPGGSMTGGSSSFKGISILGRNREITDLQQEIASRKSSLAKVETQREDLFITYRANKDSLEEIEAVLRNMDHQRSSEEESLNRTLIQKAQSEKELSILENERIDINHNLEELSISIKDSEQELTGLEEKNADINEWASESKRYLKEKLEEKETLNNKITDVRVELASMQQEIQALKDQTSRIEDDIRRFIKNIDSREQLRLTNTNEINRINGTISETNNAITSIEQTTEELQAAINKNEKQYAHEETRLQELEHDIKELSQSIVELTDKKYRFEVQFSRFEVELETYQNKMWEEYELTYSSAIQYQDASFTPTMVNQQIQVIKKDIAILSEVNVNAIEEFKRVSERFTFLSEQKGDLVTASEDLKGIIKDITKTMEVRFIEEFAIINEYFGETFRMLFGGGNAQLVLENQADVLSCGIEITAQPPGKKLQSLLLLSGGERSLTAIAILFAILKHKPTPFCVLDEIDAALDDSNVDQFSKFVKDFAKDTQFIIITHRKGTME
ncbi:MAG: chromosome segregation protein SMC, partial [Firmicutes bacterium]|nr:chromosome segregation protein SMC [Bacillota bacterium]